MLFQYIVLLILRNIFYISYHIKKFKILSLFKGRRMYINMLCIILYLGGYVVQILFTCRYIICRECIDHINCPIISCPWPWTTLGLLSDVKLACTCFFPWLKPSWPGLDPVQMWVRLRFIWSNMWILQFRRLFPQKKYYRVSKCYDEITNRLLKNLQSLDNFVKNSVCSETKPCKKYGYRGGLSSNDHSSNLISRLGSWRL